MSDEKKRKSAWISPANWSKKTKRLCLIWILAATAVLILAPILEPAGKNHQR